MGLGAHERGAARAGLSTGSRGWAAPLRLAASGARPKAWAQGPRAHELEAYGVSSIRGFEATSSWQRPRGNVLEATSSRQRPRGNVLEATSSRPRPRGNILAAMSRGNDFFTSHANNVDGLIRIFQLSQRSRGNATTDKEVEKNLRA